MDDARISRTTELAARYAEAAERDRRLAEETVAALVAAGFTRHFVPRRWGGAEGGFAELVARVAAVAEGCASAAWCATLFAAHGRFAAQLPPDGRRELWGATPDVRIAAAIAPPSGTAVPTEDGGWRLHGEWQCASGADFADWVLLAAWEPCQDGRRARVLAVPAADLTVRPSWDGVGLRGTGSNTVLVETTTVPAHRSFLLADLLAGATDPDAARCHQAPAQLAGGLMFCAPALGAARRALRVWSVWAARKSGGRPNQESAAVRETLLRSSAEIDAAQLLVTEAARRADADPVTEELVARNQRDAAVAVDLLVTAVERLLRTGGAHVREGAGELQRLWRDLHTIAGHGALRLETAAEAYAAAALPRL
ncbi:acyl-CoA dehydrogenase family protein [Kitasatospora sp. NPDC052896]|uniref:acyl-CoA dehydrogenase family protein n=1 Tax=Kitasatospora sp. NPDC052896 TaxID=3364061 RepID=UPI0037C82A0C